jgi:hypothetical protein
MVALISSMSKKKGAPLNVIQIVNIQQRMLGGCFEGLIMNRYESYDILNSLSSIYIMTWQMHVVSG